MHPKGVGGGTCGSHLGKAGAHGHGQDGLAPAGGRGGGGHAVAEGRQAGHVHGGARGGGRHLHPGPQHPGGGHPGRELLYRRELLGGGGLLGGAVGLRPRNLLVSGCIDGGTVTAGASG